MLKRLAAVKKKKKDGEKDDKVGVFLSKNMFNFNSVYLKKLTNSFRKN
jgi:hypothetical protein